MILCRRPCQIFDVDALGLAAVLLMAAVGAWLLTGPGPRVWEQRRATMAEHATSKAALHADLAGLDEFQRGVARLQETLDDHAARVPRIERYSAILDEVAAAVRDAELELISVTPQPALRDGAYLVADVEVGARGAGLDFVRFLDAMSAQNAHHALLSCRVQRPAEPEHAACELHATLRFFFLPGDEVVAAAPPNEGNR